MCGTQPTTITTTGAAPKIVCDVAHSARIWNYWLGGKDHYPVDRAAAHTWASQHLGIVSAVKQSRAFLTRAVCYLASSGVRQFLDIGTGLPFAPNLHEVLQNVVCGSRVVYVDRDPLVLAHARALLTSTTTPTTTGSSDVLAADLREPEWLVTSAMLESTTPVAVILSHVLGELTDPGEAHQILTRLIEAVAPGSYLILCEPTNPAPPRRATHTGPGPGHYRLYSPSQLAELVRDLELVAPGLVAVDRWRPDHLDITDPTPCDAYGVLAHTPRHIRATKRAAPRDPADRHLQAMPSGRARTGPA